MGKQIRRFTSPSALIVTGQSKKKSLLYMPVKKFGTVSTSLGSVTSVIVEAYGECRSCNEKVCFGKVDPKGQWIPLRPIKELDGEYALHRCDDEMKRNKALRELVYASGKV